MTETAPEARPPLRVEITPEETYDDLIPVVSAAVLAHQSVRQDFQSADLWMSSFDVIDKDPTSGGHRFLATVRDLTSGRTLRATGHVDDPENVAVSFDIDQPPPTDDEFGWALDMIVQGDRVTGSYKADDEVPYRPMPPLLNVVNPDGSIERVIAVGLRTPDSGHRVLGVRSSDGSVVHGPAGAAAPVTADCGAPPEPAEPCPAPSGARQARVQVFEGDEVVWDLVVVRPSASSGTNGSGVELRSVDYRGKRVLFRAHVPIVNVEYGDPGDSGCGPTYRDWLHEEACFGASGHDPIRGFRLCSERPETILESGVDGGEFRGVALHLDGTELVIVSQLQAGWYRYVNEWRFDADGTIRPRFGFAAASNPCTCHPHVHHAYWRFDFDILGPGENLAQEYNDPPVFGTSNWHTIRYEVRRHRAPEHQRQWRVRNVRFPGTYQLVPGSHDGTPGDYGMGDVWVLRYHDTETDDSQGFTTDPVWSRAQLDRLVSGEPVQRDDIVIWYGVHFRHGPPEAGQELAPGHRMGPDLVPRNWVHEPGEPPITS